MSISMGRKNHKSSEVSERRDSCLWTLDLTVTQAINLPLTFLAATTNKETKNVYNVHF